MDKLASLSNISIHKFHFMGGSGFYISCKCLSFYGTFKSQEEEEVKLVLAEI
jgi:hypothetical protein